MTAKAKLSTRAPEIFESAVAAGGDVVKKGLDKATKRLDDVATFNKATVEAVFKSAHATSKGLEALNVEAMAFSKQGLEDAVSATKAALTSRSVQEFIEVSGTYTKSVLESYVAQTKKMSAIFVALTKEAVEPLNGRTAALVEAVQSAR